MYFAKEGGPSNLKQFRARPAFLFDSLLDHGSGEDDDSASSASEADADTDGDDQGDGESKGHEGGDSSQAETTKKSKKTTKKRRKGKKKRRVHRKPGLTADSSPWRLARDPGVRKLIGNDWLLMRDPKVVRTNKEAHFWQHQRTGLVAWKLPELLLRDGQRWMDEWAERAAAILDGVRPVVVWETVCRQCGAPLIDWVGCSCVPLCPCVCVQVPEAQRDAVYAKRFGTGLSEDEGDPVSKSYASKAPTADVRPYLCARSGSVFPHLCLQRVVCLCLCVWPCVWPCVYVAVCVCVWLCACIAGGDAAPVRD